MGRAAERGLLHDGGYVVTLEEAMHISDHLLPGEPGSDELARWQAQRPQPEPPKRERGLDIAPAPQIDWAAIINGAIRGERAHMVEAIGQAIGQYGDELLTEVEGMIAQAIDQLRTELRAEFANQVDQLRNELSGQINTQGNELRAQLQEIIAKKKRARTKASPLQLPAPNGNAHPQ
jgi:hypothetical protein